MTATAITASVGQVRRLAVARQRLAGPLPRRVTPTSIVEVVRELGYVQWDPVTIVAPSHLLSLWARLGEFRADLLERLLWRDKRLFEHWTPMASLVLTEDYPLWASLMSRYPESLSHSWGNHRTRTRAFLTKHRALRRQILEELRSGPRTVREFAAHRTTRRQNGEFNPTSDVASMLFHLTMSGEVMVVGHEGGQNQWGRSVDFLPTWVDRRPWSESRFEEEAARRALHALGTGTPREITYYFPRGRYETLGQTLRHLLDAGTLTRVSVTGFPGREERYLLTEDIATLESIGDDSWPPRLSLLPPFDNLICSTARTDQLFGFHYVREQFLPAGKRRFGTYVLPILWGERLIGRVDPRVDRDTDTLVVNSVHAEPEAPTDRAVAEHLAGMLASLARFVGARRVRYTSRVPAIWRSSLRSASSAN